MIFIHFHSRSLKEPAFLAKRLGSIAFVLLTLNAYSLNLGYGSPVFLRLCGFLSLMVVILLYCNYYVKISKENISSLVGLVLILTSFFILFLSLNPEFWLFSIPIFICGFDLLLRSSGYNENHLPPLALGSLIYTFFYIYYIHVPSLWLSVRSISQDISGIIGRFAGVSLIVGPTISGTLILLTFISCSIAFFMLSDKRMPQSRTLLIANITGLALAYSCYILLLATNFITTYLAMDDLFFAFLILLIPFIILVSKFRVQSIDPGKLAISPKHGIVLAAIFLSISLVSISPYINTGSSGKAVIYEINSDMGFDIPHFPGLNESFEPDRGYSIGAIKLYLENIGYEVEELNATNPHSLKDALKNANILIMINLKKAFQSDELNNISDFVRNGGGLLIFGDHTSMFVSDQDFVHGRDYLNDVLEPTGIRINPDTADYVKDHWKYAISTLPNYITKDLGFEVDLGSVGASLNLSNKAKPVIIGRYAFSDKANLTTPGHLGDRNYERGEALGDLVVAASDTYGLGNVLVFGDTSYVFNNELPFKYKLVYDSIAWLRSHEISYAGAFSWASLVILIVLGLFLVRKPRPKITILFLASLAVIMALSLAISESTNDSLIRNSQKVNGEIAWIDHTHINQFDLDSYQPGGIAGLITNLFRNSYLPMVLEDKKDFPEVSKGRAMIIIAPNERYTPDEVSQLRKFVEGGGMLIISAGYKSKGQLDSILNNFEMQIENLPLGSPPWIVETHSTLGPGTVTPENLKEFWHKPKFMEAYPVSASGAYEKIAWLNYEGKSYNLAIAKKFGQGEVVLFGDSRFLLNENLEYLSLGTGIETKEQYQLQWLGNIQLLRKILSDFREVGI